jgi:hypothetical protein
MEEKISTLNYKAKNIEISNYTNIETKACMIQSKRANTNTVVPREPVQRTVTSSH